MSAKKVYTVTVHRGYSTKDLSKVRDVQGTLQELIDNFSYTLEVGASYAHEKGTHPVNQNPKSFSALIESLNNAVYNMSANGTVNFIYS